MADPAPFTLDNIRATFGHYVADPRGAILRGLAEVFCDLDPAYKSHDRVKIGVSGLPKRIILTSVGGFGSWGRDRLVNVLNAIATYQGKPLVDWAEIDALLKDEDALLKTGEIPAPHRSRHEQDKTIQVVARGVRLKRFANGNGHLHFEPDTLLDINRALAEFYGDVLPDAPPDEPVKKGESRAVSKDLQYYPTPCAVVENVLNEMDVKGLRILEPECGCGRFLDELRKRGARCIGIEVDPGRAALSRAKGHNVLTENFLETVPTGDFDRVVMNPPFAGRHYLKHVAHALEFLRPGGGLTAILPATARYDHDVINAEWAAARGAKLDYCDGWRDLPVGSFAESGTNINTSVLTMWRMG
jgi:SAM-dependent methyltransferase